MQVRLLCCILIFSFCNTHIAAQVVELDSDYCDWYFSIGKNKKQFLAIVPGSNINDLICNKIIPDPYIDNNLSELKWIEDSTFTYVTAFDIEISKDFNYEIQCEGLDTYAEVYLNNALIFKGNNMFVNYSHDISSLLRNGTNLLKIVFKSVVEIGKQKAKRDNIIYPADNEEGEIKVSPLIRKAAFQFGWDINPRLISCGIWRPIKIISSLKSNTSNKEAKLALAPAKSFYTVKLEDDQLGQSFAFYTNEKKPKLTFIYGANYVPYNMYPLPIKTYKRTAHLQKNQLLPNRHTYYRQLFSELKNYGCNMLRVWGGGWYEDEYFYNLADSMHIAIWQDFMFANTMYPGDEDWINTVKTEISQTIARLSKHPSISLWSGNNEIEVAWKNWGWQSKYHYSKQDSLKLIEAYKLLFNDIIPNELKAQNNHVTYIPSSPISNWGKLEDFKKGDNHYWGIWHGEAPLEDFNSHVPRFASEYGMPSLGVNSSLTFYNSNSNTKPKKNEYLWNRMKSYKGMKLLNQYIADYLPPPMSDTALSYASRYIQFKALKMAYNAHFYQFPVCSGSLFWQFNESWPGITWAAIDFNGQRKVPPYKSDHALVFAEKGIIKLKINANKATNPKVNLVELILKDNDGQLIKKQALKITEKDILAGFEMNPFLYFDTLDLKQAYLKVEVKHIASNNETVLWDTLLLLKKEKEYNLKEPTILFSKIDEHHLKISANTLVLGLFLESKGNAKIKFNQNFINLEPGQEKIISCEFAQIGADLPALNYFSIYNLQP